MQFSWDKLSQNLQDNALSDGNKKSYEQDERFYKLSRDDNGNGGALIRFLTDPSEVPFIKMTKINAQQGKGKPFIDTASPLTIGLPDPINEKFSELWTAGLQDEAKKYGRKFRYYTNIKVLKDPNNQGNEGKIFLLDMASSLFEKIKDAADPSESVLALDTDGTAKKEVYNPVRGNSFLLKIKTGSNGFPTYEDSRFAEKIDGIYANEAEAEAGIKENTYELGDFLKPEYFLSYAELQEKLLWFDGEKATTKAPEAPTEAPAPAPKAPTEAPAPKAEPKAEPKTAEDENLDSMLDDLLAD